MIFSLEAYLNVALSSKLTSDNTIVTFQRKCYQAQESHLVDKGLFITAKPESIFHSNRTHSTCREEKKFIQ